MEREQGQVDRAKTATGLSLEGGPAREKRWDECGIEEKVERLRRVLRVTSHTAEQAAKLAHKSAEIASLHEHGGDGKPVMPIARDPWNNQAQSLAGGDSHNYHLHLLD